MDANGDGVYSDNETGLIGGTAHWRILIRNDGQEYQQTGFDGAQADLELIAPINNIVVTDTNGRTFGPVESLLAGESVVFEYDTVISSPNLTNRVSAEGDYGEVTVRGSAEADVTATQPPAQESTVTVSPTLPATGANALLLLVMAGAAAGTGITLRRASRKSD